LVPLGSAAAGAMSCIALTGVGGYGVCRPLIVA